MSVIVVLLVSSLVTLLAVIGLADAFAHLLGHVARALKAPSVDGSGSPLMDASRHLGLMS